MLFKNNLVLRLVSALAVASAIGLLPAATYAAGPAAAAITKPPAGMGSIVLINMESGNETLTVNVGSNTYTVAPQGGSGSNQVEFNLAPGSYSYTASAPGIAAVNNSFTVTAGQVTGLTFQPNPSDDMNGAQDADDVAQAQLTTVVGNESDEHEKAKNDKDKSSSAKDKPSSKKEDKGDGPDNDETHLVLGPSVVNDNDDLQVTTADLTSQAQ